MLQKMAMVIWSMSMKTYDEYMLRQEIYQKLSVAEEDFHSGNVMDAEESLQKLRQKYHV